MNSLKQRRMLILEDNSVDCFTAFSVFNHMPDREFEAIMKSLIQVKPGELAFVILFPLLRTRVYTFIKGQKNK